MSSSIVPGQKAWFAKVVTMAAQITKAEAIEKTRQ